MTIKSMTGFARADGSAGAVVWAWEVRSVNGRGLDLRLRLPPGFESLEPKVREMVGAHVVRGSVNVNLAVKRADSGVEIRVNRDALRTVAEAARLAKSELGDPAATISIDGLLGLRGVLEFAEPVETEAEATARAERMLADFGRALASLTQSRGAEGKRLEAVFVAQLGEIERLVAEASASPQRSGAIIAQRLKDQVDRLLSASGNQLDATRLHQEAALLATRYDIEEEIKRLTVHVATARELLTAKEPVGRKFDFLTQEFNREANTLCSKANESELTRAGLALKAVIDQMREQVQNIE